MRRLATITVLILMQLLVRMALPSVVEASQFYAVANYGFVQGYDSDTGSEVSRFATNVFGHSLSGGLAFGSDGYLYGVTGGGDIGVYDLTTTSLVSSIPINANGYGFYHDITFGPDGYLYGVTEVGIGVYNVAAKSFVKSFGGNILWDYHNKRYSGLAFGSDGYLYAVSWYGTVQKFDVALGLMVGEFPTNVSGASLSGGLAFGPDGHLYGTSGAGNIGAYDVTSGALVNSISINANGYGFYHDIAFGPDGYLYGVTQGGFVGVYDVNEESFLRPIGGNVLYEETLRRQSYGGIAFEPTPPAVSEPATMLLLGAGLAGVGLIRRKLKNS